ncbi:MAG: HEAT repeat domain-containing protein [Myxococcota bacterium]
MNDGVDPRARDLGDRAELGLERPRTSAAEIENDDETLKKIGRKTTIFGRVSAFLIVGGAIFLGFVGWEASKEYEARMDGFDAIDRAEPPLDGPAVLAKLRSILATSSHDDARSRAIKNLGHLRDVDSMPLFIENLARKGPVRRDAAWAIGRIGLPDADVAREALLSQVSSLDARDEAQVLWTLALLEETRAADTILAAFRAGRFSDMDGFDAAVLIRVLGPARLSSEALMTHESDSIRLLTAHALAEASNPSVADALTRMLEAELQRPEDQQQTEVIRAIAGGLGRAGDPLGARALFDLLHRKPTLRAAVLDALAKSTAGPQLAALMVETQDVGIQRDLADLVAKSHDDRVIDALVALLEHEEGELQKIAALGLAELSDTRAAPTLFKLAVAEDRATSDAALEGLIKIAGPENAAELIELLQKLEGSQAAVIRALGATGDSSTTASVLEYLTKYDGKDQEAASRALALLNTDPGFDALRTRIRRPPAINMAATSSVERRVRNEKLRSSRRAAIQAIGLFERPEVSPDLRFIVEDPKDDYELRALAGEALGRCASNEQLVEVILKILDENTDAPARRYYLRGLWRTPRPEISSKLLDLMRSTSDPEVRRAAALAIGYGGNPEVDQALAAMLRNDELRRDAALAIVLSGSIENAHALVQTLLAHRDMRELVQERVTNTENDRFNVVTAYMFDSEQIWRRIETAHILRVGAEGRSFGYAWNKVLSVLQNGWDGVGGLNRREIRARLWSALRAPEPAKRRRAAEVLGAISEIGLLLRARDEAGVGAAEARSVLFAMNQRSQ